MATEYVDAPEVRKLARQLINDFHPHLHGARIEYVFVSKTDKDGVQQPIESKGKQMWGRARKVSGLNAYLAGGREEEGDSEFFVVEISLHAWQRIGDEQKEALVDHELCHCALDEEKGTPTTRPHDVEEFSEIVKRHGLWRHDVEQMVKIGAEKLQMALPLEAPPANDKAAAKGATKAAKAKAAKAEAPGH